MAAGGGFLLVELAARVVASVPTLPELFQDRLVQALPGPVFSFMLARLLYLGKPLLFAGLLLLQLLAAGLVAHAIARWDWRPASVVVAGLWAVTGLVLLPLAGEAPFGGSPAVAVVTLLAFAAYVLIFEGLRLPPSAPSQWHAAGPFLSQAAARRDVIAGVLLLAAAAVLARRALGAIPSLSSGGKTGGTPRSPQGGEGGLPPPMTPADQFYVVSKNIDDPTVDAGNWSLQLSGMVDHPLKLSYTDITSMPSQEFVRTLECISNEVGGDLISNGIWTGVRLSDVLNKAGMQGGAKVLNFTSVDGYTENMSLEKAMDPNTFLAYKLDGQPLPPKHGYPVRVLGVGTYGMKNPKWLTKIEVAGSAEQGFWEQQGWNPDAIVQTMSRIDSPHQGDVVPAGTVAGIAFAGDRGIQKVELSIDGGKTWQPADLLPPLGPLTWVFWRTSISLESGPYDVQVRATDGSGQLQTNRRADPFPAGSSGYHHARIEVRS
ncbi:MAG TPA: molybdopterin-dependent oxidoreductase [Chloroflexota bacterium]|nr:molybdopterin-dependent oxidoreductase [Chloroflexota bacterium]